MSQNVFKPAPIDEGKTAQQIFGERMKRFQDVLDLKQPDRIPSMVGFGYALSEWGGITRQEQQDNFEANQDLLEKAVLKHQPDAGFGVFGLGPGASKILGDQMTKWPGYGLGPDGSFQFAEQEFMKAEDYKAFLDDPSDWAFRTYLPRAFSKLTGFKKLPPLGMFNFGFYHTSNLMAYLDPDIIEGFKSLYEAAQSVAAAAAQTMEGGNRLAALGFAPPFFMGGALIEAPFDFMSDTLRGMRGIMLDMHRHKDELMAAQEKVLKFQVEFAINQAKATGLNYAFIPLHRGSDGFMSIPQFEKFYWPTLKSMLLQLIDAGIKPGCFYEGTWDQRLDYLAELPKGKTFGWFQSSDFTKVKEKLGDVMCIAGGMPNSLLQGGTPEKVREHTKYLCEVVGKGGGFIMSTTIGELEGCNEDLVKAWMDATLEYGVY